jgi:hypothetical protein
MGVEGRPGYDQIEVRSRNSLLFFTMSLVSFDFLHIDRTDGVRLLLSILNDIKNPLHLRMSPLNENRLPMEFDIDL